MSGKCVGNRDNGKYEWFLVSSPFVSIAVNRNRQSACLASVSPARLVFTGFCVTIFKHRDSSLALRMTGKAGCLRSAGLMSCFYSSRQTGIYRLLCHYRQAPRFFAPLRMTPLAGGLRPAGLMSSFCLPPPGWYLPTFVSLSTGTEILRSAQNDPSGGWSKVCRSHVFLLSLPPDRYLPTFVSLSSSAEILR